MTYRSRRLNRNDLPNLNRNGPKVLVLAAHPDDETLGCGATIKHLANKGAEIMLLTFTDGTGARRPQNDPNDSNDQDEQLENRNDRLEDVCRLLGISRWASANFPDNRMDSVDLLDLVKFIEEQLEAAKFRPQIIFTHHPDCLNVDHSLVYRATITAFRPQVGKRQTIYSYYIPSSTDYNPLNKFQGNAFYRVDHTEVQSKMDVLTTIYNDEMRKHPHSRSNRNVLNLMKVWGAEIGTEFAEKFQMIRDIR